MSSRRNTSARNNGNAIRGPQSALTDFLAANNISANQIRLDYLARVRAQELAQPESAENGGVVDDVAEDVDQEMAGELAEQIEEQQKKKKKRKAEATLKKIKKSKEFAKNKKRLAGEPGEDDNDELAWDMYSKSKPLPGQLENCEICDKRFTVTPYSKEGPDGGLLCTKCSKEQEAEKKKEAKANKAPVGREKRRKLQSNILDHRAMVGSKSLEELCVEMVASNINNIDEFGDLPPSLLDRLSQILSKRRVLTSRTLDLFLRPDRDVVSIYDCAKLSTDDYTRIFAVTPKLQSLTLENCGQMKDEVLDYMLERNVLLRSLKLEAANLINDAKWKEFFDKAGMGLEILKLTWLDYAMDDKTAVHLVKGCPNLKYLKLKKCFRLGEASLELLGQLQKLEHLSLQKFEDADGKKLNALIHNVGPNLRVLSLQNFENADDQTLEMIHKSCHKLRTLKFTENEICTDAGFAALFTEWSNPPLTYANFADNRDIDHNVPDGPEDPVGFASGSLKALMAHSGSRLERLVVKSCRHITREALLEVFDGVKRYPFVKEVDFSFVNQLDTVVVAGLLISCPVVERIIAFGCFDVKDVILPRGVALIGGAHDSIVQEGTGFRGDF